MQTLRTRFGYGTGLFTADQQLSGDLPIYTRQNAGGTQYGFEIPQERDYFPYWGPTPWKDIAIMVSDKNTEGLMKKYVNSSHYGHKCEFATKLFVMSIPMLAVASIFIVGSVFRRCVNQFYSILSFRKRFVAN